MSYPRYTYKAGKYLTSFEFVSVGKRGSIKKVVGYAPMSNPRIYNLGFGDWNEETQEVDDSNGDMVKVLSTVVATMYEFTEVYPEIAVYATGSNETRTRLYRINIAKHLAILQQDFYVYGQNSDGSFETFEVNKEYIGFMVKRK
ncbi:hypothetical protein SAMN05444369_104117 [Capnocytophaga haemolytica]|jgi:hypothetical protein|uniref:Uncharacterized protein n=1 Tax=Capnocytophaga haemolytica TaxID=45243 RepID=A0AAX2H1E2_9FLAO|nr:hypothetical protein [Capnocytophaga haemolytica]AMD85662.1 hypothetical protein AXF12_09145 [Capnocytophaga haemolytica]SFN90165.1 hypothetical protein SAMN05444369_104117 [Capnocytophaga haemolytica]SNV16509.1 Uncharacterised protein [Capnocytophaga haemolytica]